MGKVLAIVGGIALLGASGVYGAMEFDRRWYFDGLRPVARAQETSLSSDLRTAPADRPAPNVSGGAIADTQDAEPRVRVAAAAEPAPPTVPDTTGRAALAGIDAPRDTGAQSRDAVSASPIAPVIAEGRTELGDSVYAVREGRTVMVHFDTYLTRTRRRDKFDRIVRQTLPRIYGAPADSLLSTVPVGQIAQGGDLLGELPQSGLRFELADGSRLALWPHTRPGRDGPLVVAYRATILR